MQIACLDIHILKMKNAEKKLVNPLVKLALKTIQPNAYPVNMAHSLFMACVYNLVRKNTSLIKVHKNAMNVLMVVLNVHQELDATNVILKMDGLILIRFA